MGLFSFLKKLKKKDKLNAKGTSNIMGVLALVIASILSIIIANAFIEAGNFTGTMSTLANTIQYVLIGIAIFAGISAMGLFGR